MTCSIISTCAAPCWMVVRRCDGIDVADLGRDRGPIGEVGADEDDPGVGLGRTESEGDVGAVEESDPAHLRRAGERALRTLGGEHSLQSFRTGPDRAAWCEARAPDPGRIGGPSRHRRAVGRATLPARPRTRASSRPGRAGRSDPGRDRDRSANPRSPAQLPSGWAGAGRGRGGRGRRSWPRRRPSPWAPGPPVALYIRFRLYTTSLVMSLRGSA